ncbi:hypothetical protein PM082_009739 [Marasmius tenuissimus]|nr:hypothetical protein PM082_009739 [Marasmius tenuissimus]
MIDALLQENFSNINGVENLELSAAFRDEPSEAGDEDGRVGLATDSSASTTSNTSLLTLYAPSKLRDLQDF